MKTLKFMITLCILLCIIFSVSAQDDATLYKIKIDRYQTMQYNSKIVMIYGAAAITTVGLGLRIAALGYPENKSDDNITTASYVLMGAGVVAVIPGLIFHNIGKRKSKEYQMKLDSIKTGFYYTPEHSGILLTYTF